MENGSDVSRELRLAELRKESLAKSCELAHAHASSVMDFTLKWKELEDHLDETTKSIVEKGNEVDSRQKRLEDRERVVGVKESELILVQTKIDECNRELESKVRELGCVRDCVEEFKVEIERKETEFDIVRSRVEDCKVKLEGKETELVSVQTRIDASNGELESKLRELGCVQNCVEECKVELEGKQRELGSVRRSIEDCKVEIEGKKRDLGLVQERIEKCSCEYKRSKGELDGLRMSVLDWTKKLIFKKEELSSVEGLIEKCLEEIKEREQLQNSMGEQLELRKTELSEIENLIKTLTKEYREELGVRAHDFSEIKKSIEAHDSGLDSKTEERRAELLSKGIGLMEKELKSVQESVEKCTQDLEQKKKQLCSVQKSVEELSDELISEELELDLVRSMASQGFKDLKQKEEKFKERVQEFEVKEKHFYSMQKEMEEKRKALGMQEKQITSIAKIEQPESLGELGPECPNSQSCILGNGRILHFLLKEHLNKHDLFLCEISTAIKSARDPAKLVLDAMKGFYPRRQNMTDYDVTVIRRSCILLLELLLSFSPPIAPPVRDEALKLAGKWKAKMRVAVNKSLEEIGFLHLVAAFGLTSDFDGSELHKLLDTAVPHYQTSEFSRALGITNELPVIPSQIKTVQSEHIPVSNTIDPTSTDHLPVSMAIEESHDLMPGEVTVAHSDPSKFVLDFIQGIYSDNRKEEGTDVEEVVMKNYIFLLAWVKEAVRKIDTRVKAQAMKLAAEWKSKIRAVAENSLEVLCFLQLLVTYQLVAFFDREDILNLFVTVAHLKQAPEICRDLGFVDMVPDFVQKLIGRNEHLQAVRFICAFKLIDEISPLPVIAQYLDNVRYSSSNIFKAGNNSLDTNDKTIGLKIDSLRALIQCIKDCKLESAIGTQNQDIQACIVMLEQEKAAWNQHVSASNPITPQLLQAEYGNFGASAPTNQPASGPMFHPQHVENYPSSSGASGLGNIQNGLAMLGKENTQWKHYVPSPNIMTPQQLQANHSSGASGHVNQLQQQNSFKRPRTEDPSFIGDSTPQVPVLGNPSAGSPGVWHGPGVAANNGQGVLQAGTGYTSSPGGWVHLAAANRDAQQPSFWGNQFSHYFQPKQN